MSGGGSSDHRRAVLGIFTTQCRGGSGVGLEETLPAERTTFYAYGRQALAEGLRRVGVGPGDEVLLPEFICGEVLSSVALVGARPRYYAVAPDLGVADGALAAQSPSGIRAVLAVNYFGFPQDLTGFKTWSRTHGVPLIEDNAHGFLSADGTTFLGRRGDVGVFSLRKTLSIPNGAALVDNRAAVGHGAEWGFHDSCSSAERRHRLRTVLKTAMRYGTLATARAVVSAIRSAKCSESASGCDPHAETIMPREAVSAVALRLLRQCDITAETERRRSLYRYCADLFAGVPGVQPLFRHLPDGVVPQGFPFRYQGTDPKSFQDLWWGRGLPIVVWPDRLPAAVASTAPRHYRTTMLVQFLW